jgi:hypothetical protein
MIPFTNRASETEARIEPVLRTVKRKVSAGADLIEHCKRALLATVWREEGGGSIRSTSRTSAEGRYGECLQIGKILKKQKQEWTDQPGCGCCSVALDQQVYAQALVGESLE